MTTGARGWTQEILTARLQVAGMNKDRAGVGKIESQLIHVSEYELYYFARVFDVKAWELLVELSPDRRVDEQLAELLKPRNHRRSAARAGKG
jgi:hypothetical protein